jgi:hypothetical protein
MKICMSFNCVLVSHQKLFEAHQNNIPRWFVRLSELGNGSLNVIAISLLHHETCDGGANAL